jgi:excisionase family DNA binding protein
VVRETDKPTQYYTLAAAAKRMGMSKATLMRAIKDREITVLKRGPIGGSGRILIPSTALDAWLRDHWARIPSARDLEAERG